MIPAENRNDVRIMELPACKMVWSGICTENEPLTRFNEWWTAPDALRKDRFFARDFMWWDEKTGGYAWGFAVPEMPAAGSGMDTGGYEIIDFPGGLYAVANFVDDDEEPGGGIKIYTVINAWVENSSCFKVDTSRYCLNHFIGTPTAKEAMGYGQQDLYVPIRIREDGEK